MTKPTLDLREKALGYLTRREYSRAELTRKLQPYADPETIDALLDEFTRRGWLSDQRYADQMAHARRGKAGSLKLAHELRAHGVADALVSVAVAEFKQGDRQSAHALWQKKFGALPESREAWAKQARFLQGRGFDLDTIKAVLRGTIESLE